ncbi:MAG: hypothetical protein R3251_00610 [Candidatus Spechtbacterales bacterium]|nr:hypothetical protein [Candidatus Spechtbacterales bacterium]
MGVKDDFVSHEPREYRVKLGGSLASALAGFVAGVICTSVIFYVVLEIVKNGA